MTTPKTTRRRSKAASPSTKLAGIVTNEADPQSWLFLNPMRDIAMPAGMVFGNLRKSYGLRINSAVEFGRRKLQPIAPLGDAQAAPWPVTAERHDVVLPEYADDKLAEPRALLAAMDATAIDKTLLVYVTLSFPQATRVHQAFETSRAFAAKLARERHLASLLVLHAPGRVGSANSPHCHLLIAPRAIGPLGIEHGVYDTDLCCDRGQKLMVELWKEFEQDG
ncbi:MAG: hypothetical protein EOP62_00430 [Sphingomonadales bacterium]|nr:MAG: hypothetical protein EOP62_00430 [Sphingomonadales bacterium]